MPEVTSIYIGSVRVYGTILAPQASVKTANNNIQGQLIVKDFSGNLQVDWVKFKACLPTINHTQKPDTKTEPEPESKPEPKPEPEPEPKPDEKKAPSEPEELPQDKDSDETVTEVVAVTETVQPEIDSDEEVKKGVKVEVPVCENEYPFGIVSNFGAFSFNNFVSSSSDVQGRLAAKNLVDVSSYSINEYIYGGGKFRCDQEPLKSDFPFSLVAGTIKMDNGGIYNGGIAYTNSVDGVVDYIKNSITNNGCQVSKIPNLIDFDEVENNMNKISEELATLSDTKSVNFIFFF